MNDVTKKPALVEAFSGHATQIGVTILGPAANFSLEPLYYPNTELFNENRSINKRIILMQLFYYKLFSFFIRAK